MKRRKIGLWIAVAVLALGIAAALIYTRPQSLPSVEGEALNLVWVDGKIVVENFAALPKDTSQTYRFSPESEGYDALASALASLSYRRCFHTLTGTDFDWTEDWGMLRWLDQEVLVASSEHLIINGTTYRSASAGELLTACEAAIASLPEEEETTQ